MKFLRNPEIKKCLFLQLLICFIFAGIGFYFDTICGVIILFASLIFILIFIIFTRKRYRKVESLSQQLDAMLHSNSSGDFSDYMEGELAILQNELAKLTRRLAEQNQALENDKKYLADAMADISHQLRSPLTSIRLLLTLLKEPALFNEKRLESLRELSLLIDRMDWLIETLLKLSSMDAGTITFHQTETSVKELLSTAAAPLLIPLELRDIQYHETIEPKDFSFSTDLRWTAEALGNILKNCMEHTPSGGRIDVTVTDNPIYVSIVIEDNGSGFLPEDIPHLFERFYKGKNATGQSIGIGLSLSRMIVSKENGTLKAENRKEGGARFILKFYKK